MESTKRIAMACSVGLAYLVVPAFGQDQPLANTAVELREHVQAPQRADDNRFENHPVQDGADTTETQQVATTQEPDRNPDGQIGLTERAVDDAAYAETESTDTTNVDIVAGQTLGDEQALIPRGRSDQTTGTAAQTAKTGLPWYRSPFIALFVVLGLIGAVAAAFRRWVPAARTANIEHLRIVGRTAISSKQSVVLLHVGKRIVLLGATADAVNMLSEITDEAEVAMLLGRGESTRIETNEFDSALAREFEQYESADTPDTSLGVPSTDDATVSRESVEGIMPEPIADAKPQVPVQTGEKKRNQLNDLLARLRTLQKT
ncbi:MAG: FliO/MopB family protein [Planctomycetes bacterium]|nr:FliO/MopB family protein [Planctomycetota bacterium]